MSQNTKRCVLTLSFCSTLVFAGAAAAQQADPAEELFNRGAADMEAGRYATGCPAIAESLRLDPRLGTLFSLALCEDRWGRIASAVTHYNEFLALYEKLPEDKKASQSERVKVAKAQREKLTPEVPELTLVLPTDAPPGTVVKRGEQVLTSADLGVGVRVDPGEYVVMTQPPGGPAWEQRVSIVKGEKKKVMLEVKLPPKAEPLPTATSVPESTTAAPIIGAPSPSAGPSGRRVASFVIGGVGVAGLVLGGVMGGLAAGQKGVVNEHCGNGIGSQDPTACDQTGLDAADGGKTFALVSTIGLAVGAAGVVTAVVLLFTEPKAAKSAAGAGRRWISAGVLSAGPAEITIGARGAW